MTTVMEKLSWMALILCVALLGACTNGGGGSSGGPVVIDQTPTSFSFTPVTDADIGATLMSSMTVSGVDGRVAVVVSGDGAYRIGDNGEFITTSGEVENGDVVYVQVQAAALPEQTVSALLKVGSMTREFIVTTAPDNEPPVVNILFPPPASMTAGDSIFVRGSATDLPGTTVSVSVVLNEDAPLSLSVESDGSWQVPADLVLNEGLNAVSVIATDAAGNVSSAQQVQVTKGELSDAFPNNDTPFSRAYRAEIVEVNGKMKAFVTDTPFNGNPAIMAVDLETGERTILSDNTTQPELPLDYPEAIYGGFEGYLYVIDLDLDVIFKIDINTGVREVIDDSVNNDFSTGPRGIGGAVLGGVPTLFAGDRGIYTIDLNTLEVADFSSFDFPNGNNRISDRAYGISVEPEKNRLVVADGTLILSVDIGSGARSIIGDLGYPFGYNLIPIVGSDQYIITHGAGDALYIWDESEDSLETFANAVEPNSDNPVNIVFGAAHYQGLGYMVVPERQLNGLLAVDLVSRKRVIISKSENPQE